MDSDTKLKELSLYIAEKSKTDPSFGAIKLNKILFASDFFFYGAGGKAITEAEYVHRGNGPVPKRMPAITDFLEKEGRATVEQRTYFGHTQKRLVPLTGANTSIFEKNELDFVDAMIEHFKPWNGTQLSDWTHTLLPWLLSREGETIPYHTVFSMKQKDTVEQEAIEWAKAEIRGIDG